MSKSEKEKSEAGGEKKKPNGMARKSRSNDKTSTEIVNKHVHDKHDVITEEDFKNLNIDAGSFYDTSLQLLQISNDTEWTSSSKFATLKRYFIA